MLINEIALTMKRKPITKFVIQLNRSLPGDSSFRGKIGHFLNINGNFSKLSNNTWLFDRSGDAKTYASDIYDWGSLADYITIRPINLR